jgi:hypothetical protein
MAQPEYTTYADLIEWWRANPTATLYECRRACRVSAEKATEARREALATAPTIAVEGPPTPAEGTSTPLEGSLVIPTGTAPASGPARAPEREGTGTLTRVIEGETSRLYQGEDSVWLVFSDVHFPFQDPRVVDRLLWFSRMLKPDGVIAGGDTLDFYELSRFSKDPRRKTDTSLNNELRQARTFLRSLKNGTGARWLVWMDGNHEARLARHLADRTPELSTLETPDGELILTVPHLLELDGLGYQYLEYGDYFTLGDLDFEHGTVVSKPAASPAGMTARNTLIRRGRSVAMGHVHTQAHVINTDRGGYYHALEIGCCCQLVPEYDRNARWAHGWLVVTVRDGKAYPELVQVRDGRVFWRGEIL